MGATSKWNVAEADFPRHGTARDKLGFAAKYAMLAQSEHGWQPWEVRLGAEFAEIFATSGPMAEMLDPEGREAFIHCGAAVQYFRLALKHFNCLGRMEVFPDLAQPALVARIHTGVMGERDDRERRLFNVMNSRSDTDHSWFDEPRTDDSTLMTLSNALVNGRGWLEVVRSEASRRRLEALIASPQLHVNEVRFQRAEANRLPDGAVRINQPTGATFLQRFSRWRRPAQAARFLSNPSLTDDETNPKSSPGTFAVLKTKTDEKHAWLVAGQNMALLTLQARNLGLSCVFLNRVLRQPSVRAELRTGFGHKGFVQGIARFGSINQLDANRAHFTRSTTVTGNSA